MDEPSSATFSRREAGAWGNPPWPVAWVTLARATRHRFLTRKLLHDLDDERQLFCSISMVKMDHRKSETGRWLESLVTTVTFGGTSALETMAGGPPPSGGSSREASTWWVVGCGKQGRRLGFDI
jgi:hypothetical protein